MLKKLFRKIAKKYNDSSFMKKMLFIYIFCGSLPMLLLLGVYYISTTNILLDQVYDHMTQNMETTENSLSQVMQPYQTLMEVLNNDDSLQLQLNMNYYYTSYSDLAYYAKDTLESMIAMYPELEEIHFYSDNTSLPDDQHYFFLTGDLDKGLLRQVENSSGKLTIANDPNSEDSFVMVMKMNGKSSSGYKTYLEFQISKDLLRKQVYLDSEGSNFYFLSPDGSVVTDVSEKETYNNISDLIPDWNTMKSNGICQIKAEDGQHYICMKSELENGMSVLMTVNQDKILYKVHIMPVNIIVIFALMECVLITIVLMQSRNMNYRLKKILWGMKQIGQGKFDQKLEPMGGDEFGQIAEEVNEMGSQISLLIQDNYQNQLTIKSTELNLLQEQINPHFLYNALAVISSMAMRENARDTISCIRYLADFYRISLNKGREIIHVREEVELLRNYMKIQELRFSDLVEISYETDPELDNYYTIKLLLQPLVENAIHHAREEETFLSILVRVYEKEERICFAVEDDGKGIDPDRLATLQQALLRQEEGFGLKNVDKRIKLAYGQAYGVHIDSWVAEEPGQKHGTCIRLEIPKVTERV